MGFDLGPELLEVLNDRAVDGATEICMLICDGTSLVSNSVVYILQRGEIGKCMNRQVEYEHTHLEASFTEELITRPERDLNDRAEFCQFFCGIVLYIRDALNRQMRGRVSFRCGD